MRDKKSNDKHKMPEQKSLEQYTQAKNEGKDADGSK